MENKISLKKMRRFIKNHGGYYNLWSKDNWLPNDVELSNPDWAGISTKMLYNALTYEEPDEIIYIIK